MSARRILRIVISLGVIVLLWTRVIQDWREYSGLWLFGSITLSLLLLLVVVTEVTGAQQRWRKQRDQIPKKPLGLDT